MVLGICMRDEHGHPEYPYPFHSSSRVGERAPKGGRLSPKSLVVMAIALDFTK